MSGWGTGSPGVAGQGGTGKGKKVKPEKKFAPGNPAPMQGSVNYPALGLPAGPGYDTLDLAKTEYYRGFSYLPAMTMDPDSLMDLQIALEKAGYLDEYTLGVWDNRVAAGYENLLRLADQRGQPWQAALAQETTARKKEANEKATRRAPLKVYLSDRESVKQVANAAAQDLYGGELPEETIDAIAGVLNARERDFQTAKYNFEGMEGGEFAQSAPDASAITEQVVKERHPDQVDRVQFQSVFDQITSTLRGTGL
jgi:hypothetical protein